MIVFDEIKEAVAIGLMLSFMIGPVFFVLLQTSIVNGLRAALIFNLGVLISDIVFIAIAYLGSKPILDKLQNDFKILLIGGLILFIYGIFTFFKKPEIIDINSIDVPPKKNKIALFIKGFLLNFINVGVLGFWLGTLIVMGPRLGMNQNKIFVFFGLILVSYFTIDLGKIYLAKKLQKKLTQQNLLYIQKGLGVFLVLFGCVLLAKSYLLY